MTTRFADPFFFLALLNPADAAIAEARRFALKPVGFLVTTARVLIEVADALAAPVNRPVFLGLLAKVRSNPAIEVIPPDPALFDRGLDLYSRRPDKSWSLTDCVSFVVMTDRGLTEALTGDHPFEQAGFRALLRSG